MKPSVVSCLPFAAVLVLASCKDPAPVPPVVAAATAKPLKSPKPAAPPAVKSGKLTVIDITTLFPRQQAGTVLLYDARPGFIAGFGKIPGAISWPRGDFETRLAQSEAEIHTAKTAGKPVVFYCTDAACPDAQAMAERLTAKGHDVSILEGGFALWKEAGLPTE
jgi:rhodanese-related sulfurtransferase